MSTQQEITQHYAPRRRKQRERLTAEELQKRCEVFLDKLLTAAENSQQTQEIHTSTKTETPR